MFLHLQQYKEEIINFDFKISSKIQYKQTFKYKLAYNQEILEKIYLKKEVFNQYKNKLIN